MALLLVVVGLVVASCGDTLSAEDATAEANQSSAATREALATVRAASQATMTARPLSATPTEATGNSREYGQIVGQLTAEAVERSIQADAAATYQAEQYDQQAFEDAKRDAEIATRAAQDQRDHQDHRAAEETQIAYDIADLDDYLIQTRLDELASGDCDPSYPDFCIPPYPPDLDCKDIPISGFTVFPPDPHFFDADFDGIGCEWD